MTKYCWRSLKCVPPSLPPVRPPSTHPSPLLHLTSLSPPNSSTLHPYLSPSLLPLLLLASLSPLPLVPDTSLTSPSPPLAILYSALPYLILSPSLRICPLALLAFYSFFLFMYFLPPSTSLWTPPSRSLSTFWHTNVSLVNFLLCSICPFPTSPTPFQQTHLLNGCSPYMRAGAHTARSCQRTPQTVHALPRAQQQGECHAAEDRTGWG